MEEHSVENVAGRSTRAMAKRRFRLAMLVVLIGIAILLFLLGVQLSARSILISLLIIGVLPYVDKIVMAILDVVKKREGDAIRGAEAEEAVGAILNRLPSETHKVVHDITADFGNIDHLVFRRDGAVFFIETKSQDGEITEDRGLLLRNRRPFLKDFLKQTHGNVYWLRDFLKARFGIEAWINAAIVFPNAYVSVRRPLRGVEIVNGKYLWRWMAKARGNPQIAQTLWPQTQKLKTELLARQSHAAPH